jgi:uncharacterized membrane protein YdjX (TVP38/TMEM64 family)
LRHYLSSAAVVLAFFLVLFLVAEAAGIPVLEDPTPWLERAGWLSAVVGVSLLAVDVLLPIPSNVVMVAHGALFGTLVGTLLSLAGSMLAAAAGFWIGRRGGSLLTWAVPAEERARANAVLERWGVLAIVVSRPLPLLAETITVLAGASPLGWGRALLAAFVGSLPPCLFYAWAGASSVGFEGSALIFGAVIMLAAGVGLAGRQLEQTRQRRLASGSTE